MFLLRNKKDISIFRMKKAPYLLLCVMLSPDFAQRVVNVNKSSDRLIVAFIACTCDDMRLLVIHLCNVNVIFSSLKMLISMLISMVTGL